MLDDAPDLLAIGCFCIGTNQVDLAAAAERGHRGLQRAVLQHPQRRRARDRRDHRAGAPAGREDPAKMHDGVWDKSAKGSHEVRGRTLGIVGYGNIGTQLSNLAEALGLRVIFFDTADRLAHGNARRVQHPRRAARRGRRRLAPRRRAAGQRRASSAPSSSRR